MKFINMGLKKAYLYWLIPLILFGVQVVYTTSSNHQIRNEEAVSSIREVWWFANHSLYQPPNANVGWYMALNLIYSVFGFDLYAGKIYRLLLHLVSIYALAYLLKKYLGEKWAILPLFTIGLSPTLLFWNTVNNPYGIDLQFLPIVLALILSNLRYLSYLGWFLAMVAWMSFPTFWFYLPALAFWQVLHLRGVKAHLGGVITGLAFLLPLLGMVVYFKGWPGKLFFSGGTFEPGNVDFFASLAGVFTNLFGRANAYYLEIAQVDFSLIFPILAIALVFVTSFRLLKDNSYNNYNVYKFYILLAFLVIVFNLIIVGFTVDGGMPGGRRSTPILAAVYGLFVVAWWWAAKKGVIRGIGNRWVIRGVLGLILLHHLIVLPLNWQSVKSPSFFKLNIWFGSGNPNEGLGQIIRRVEEKDLYLSCEQTYKGDPQCQYGIIYAAVAQACLYNHLNCHKIYGYFPTVGYQELSIETINYWQENDFEH